MVKRILIPRDIPEEEQVLGGFATLQRELGDGQRAILFLPTKRQVEWGFIPQAIGEGPSKALKKGESVTIGRGSITLETEQTARWIPPDARAVLGVYPSKVMLDRIDAAPHVELVVIADPTEAEWTRWHDTWRPTVPGRAPAAPAAALSPFLEEAMRSLTGRINLSTGLTHPRDRAAAIHLLRFLAESGEAFDAAELRAWAARNGWTPDGANQLLEIAQGVLEGKRSQAGALRDSWSADYLREMRDRHRRRT